MTEKWTAEDILARTRGYEDACVIIAAAELDLVPALSEGACTADELASRIRGDAAATAKLADALCALGILEKKQGHYSPATGVTEFFAAGTPGSVRAMARHRGNCLRSWSHLAEVARDGEPHDRSPSILGAEEDRRSFIEAMEVASREAAPRVVASLGDLPHRALLDLGGGPGTWTRAFLQRNPELRAILYDLPEVLPIAREHLSRHGLLDRVELVEGDFYRDEKLPEGADLVWLSAITHQNSRAQNRQLFGRIHAALSPGGTLMIRDMVMREDHVMPRAGAMFAINMLVNTPAGGTYSLEEQREDLAAAGLRVVGVQEGDRDMDWVIRAERS